MPSCRRIVLATRRRPFAGRQRVGRPPTVHDSRAQLARSVMTAISPIGDRPADRAAAGGGRRTAAGLPGVRRTWAPGSPPPATSCTWSAGRCGTRCWAGWAKTSTSPPTPGRSRCWNWSTAGPTAPGEPGSISARSGSLKAGLRLEITTFRSDLYDGDTRNPVVTFGDSLDGDLLRRDFAVNAMAVSLPGHEFVDPFGGLEQLAARILDTPGAPEQLVPGRPAADAAGGPVRLPAVVRAGAAGGRGDDGDGGRDRPDHPGAGGRRAGQAHPRCQSAGRPGAADRYRAGQAGAAGAAGPAAGGRTSTTSTRTSTSTR